MKPSGPRSLMDRVIGGFGSATDAPSPDRVSRWLSGGADVSFDDVDLPRPLRDLAIPDDAVAAALLRQGVVTRLHRTQSDPDISLRLATADPVLAQDAERETLVTKSLLRSRFALIDMLHALLGKPSPSAEVRDMMTRRLQDAFAILDARAQQEWALSEVRLAEAKRLVSRRDAVEIRMLSEALRASAHSQGNWEAMRLLGQAARLALGDAAQSPAVADPLELAPRLRAA